MLRLDDAEVAHAGNGYVVEVLATLRLRVISVPARGHGRVDLHVGLAAVGVEDVDRATTDDHGLEEGEIRIRLHRGLEDVVGLDSGLILVESILHERALLVVRHVWIAGNGVELCLEVHLLQGQLLDLSAIVGALDVILIRHGRVRRLHLHVLGGVDGHVDELSVDAQAIKLWVARGLGRERERAVGG